MERDAFLSRVRRSLGRTDEGIAPFDGHGAPDFYRTAPLGEAGGDRVARFVAEVEGVGGRVLRVSTAADAGDALRSLIGDGRSVMAWDRSEFDGWEVDWLWDEGHVAVDGCSSLPPSVSGGSTLSGVGVGFGLTTVDSAVANTGTLVLSVSTGRPRSVSLVVGTHVALVRVDQVVDRLGEAFARYHGPMPSGVYCITGPSRSADIENDLTIGVHGPSALVVILMG